MIDIDVADPLEIWCIQNHLGKWQKEQYRGVKKRVLLAMRKREQSISFNWNDLIITTFKLKRNEVFVRNSKQWNKRIPDWRNQEHCALFDWLEAVRNCKELGVSDACVRICAIISNLISVHWVYLHAIENVLINDFFLPLASWHAQNEWDRWSIFTSKSRFVLKIEFVIQKLGAGKNTLFSRRIYSWQLNGVRIEQFNRITKHLVGLRLFVETRKSIVNQCNPKITR